MDLMLVLFASILVSAGGAKVRLKEETPGLLAKAKVTPAAAAAAAEPKVPKARLTSAEIEREGNKLI